MQNISYICGIPIAENDIKRWEISAIREAILSETFSIDPYCTNIIKTIIDFKQKYKDYDSLIDMMSDENHEAMEVFSILWKYKCELYWNERQRSNSLSFLFDYIKLQKEKEKERMERLLHLAQVSKDDLGTFSHIKATESKIGRNISRKINELMSQSWKGIGYQLNNSAIDELCSYINDGIEDIYHEENKKNIHKLFKIMVVDNGLDDASNIDGRFDVDVYSRKHKEACDINIHLPIEGLVSGNYLFEKYHNVYKKATIRYALIWTDEEEKRKAKVRKVYSTKSSYRYKLKDNGAIELKRNDNKLLRDDTEAGNAVKLIEELLEYVEYFIPQNDIDNKREDSDESVINKKRQTNIIESIIRQPFEWCFDNENIIDDKYKRYILFRSELLRNIDIVEIEKIRRNNWFTQYNIFENIEKIDERVRAVISRMYLLHRDDVYESMEKVYEYIRKYQGYVNLKGFQKLQDDKSDLQNICSRIYSWIERSFLLKLINTRRELSDNLRKTKLEEIPDKQKKMFDRILKNYEPLWNQEWLNEYLDISTIEKRKEVDGLAENYYKKLKNPHLVQDFELDFIQKILIYQLCKFADKIILPPEPNKDYVGRQPKQLTLASVLHPKTSMRIRYSIWLDLLIQKQFYVNIGFSDVWDLVEDCHNTIEDEYIKLIKTGNYRIYGPGFNGVINEVSKSMCF